MRHGDGQRIQLETRVPSPLPGSGKIEEQRLHGYLDGRDRNPVALAEVLQRLDTRIDGHQKIGLSTIVAMPRTFMVPCVLSHSVSSTVMPPMAMSTLPESSASLAAGPELNLLLVTLGAGMPRRVACFSISFSS